MSAIVYGMAHGAHEEIKMSTQIPRFKSFEITAKNDNVAKHSVVICRRAYMKGRGRLTIELHNGWGDRPDVIRCDSISIELRARIKDWIGL